MTVLSVAPPSDLEGRLTITVVEAARYYGIGKSAAYDAARRGEIPTLRLGSRLVVPVAAMLRQLGVEASAEDE